MIMIKNLRVQQSQSPHHAAACVAGVSSEQTTMS